RAGNVVLGADADEHGLADAAKLVLGDELARRLDAGRKRFSLASIGPDVPVRFVLELKRGTAQKTGISDGVRIRHPLIDRVAGAG
ncbi:hypothetical protein RSW31_24950, partial [Escherichia coli]|uniref:hypothetical protein n=1 Tax=Escherichia coli TaxID=562 RepID=UPI0028DE8F0A